MKDSKKQMPKPDRSKFVFRRHDSIGATDAEEDSQFLNHCFVDNGDLEALRDISCSKRIVLGRTGSGKSALLIKLNEVEQRCITVKPESLSLSYISNSTILRFFSELGVNLDIFFRLLWRHVFTVEILKHHFKIDTEDSKKNFIETIFNLFRDKKHQNAIQYLRMWGESFWEETEYRIKEVTTKLEEDLKSSVSADAKIADFSIDGARSLSEEKKLEIIQRAQTVVNSVQIRQLSDILELVNDVLKDPQKKYFIAIDRLDEDWIEERLRYRLIRALVETVKDFNKVKQVKIIIAIRVDLLDRVFRLTRDSGFQEEKYESLYLPVEWDRRKMVQVLDARIGYLVKQRYTKQVVTHQDILPIKVDGDNAVGYILERTTLRPRDLIVFINCCLDLAENRPQLTAQIIRDAEAQYSLNRLRSLADEWSADYPCLADSVAILRNKPAMFSLSDIDPEEVANACLSLVIATSGQRGDSIVNAANGVFESGDPPIDFLKVAFQAFQRVGILGLKINPNEATLWTSAKRRTVSKSEIKETVRVSIHPAYWRALGIQRRRP